MSYPCLIPRDGGCHINRKRLNELCANGNTFISFDAAADIITYINIRVAVVAFLADKLTEIIIGRYSFHVLGTACCDESETE